VITSKTGLRIPALCLLALLYFATVSQAQITNVAWSAPLRGMWVQNNKPLAKDVMLVGKGKACEIVVSNDEDSAVKQAALFLAGDIEKICGVKPKIVAVPSKDVVHIRLVTLDKGHLSLPI
jgi:hypothetical protein